MLAVESCDEAWDDGLRDIQLLEKCRAKPASHQPQTSATIKRHLLNRCVMAVLGLDCTLKTWEAACSRRSDPPYFLGPLKIDRNYEVNHLKPKTPTVTLFEIEHR